MVRMRTLLLPTSITPTAAVRALRKLAAQAGWESERKEGTRLVDRWAIIMPLTRRTRTLGMVLLDGPLAGISLDTWSHVQGSAGSVCNVEWRIPTIHTGTLWRALFINWTANLPRCPYRWTFGERSVIGFMLPLFSRSRRLFRNEGITTGRKGWPPLQPPQWPPDPGIYSDDEE